MFFLLIYKVNKYFPTKDNKKDRSVGMIVTESGAFLSKREDAYIFQLVMMLFLKTEIYVILFY